MSAPRAAAWASFALGLLGGCQAGTPLVIDVAQIPEEAAALEVLISLAQHVAPERPRFALPPPPRKASFSFSIHLPEAAPGQSIAVAARAHDALGCTLALGATAPTPAVGTLQRLEVPLAPLAPRDCASAVPRSLQVTPPRVSTAGTDLLGKPARVTLRGWGLLPGASVRVAGSLLAAPSWISPAEIAGVLPDLQGRFGPVELSVQNTDGTEDTRGDLLSLYDAEVGFTGVRASIFAKPGAAHVDLNRDGKADLLWLDPGVRTLEVLLNQGDGTFPNTTASVSTGGPIAALTTGDVDGDGHVDVLLASATQAQGDFSVLRNRGDGTFAEAARGYLLSGAARVVTAADLNGDGRLDGVVGTALDAVDVLLNRGQGSFPPVATSYGLAGVPLSIATPDLDGDGRPDLLINTPGRVQVLLNQGDGTFPAAPLLPFAGLAVAALRAVDLNQDGRPDLVAITRRAVAVALNQGMGRFSPAASYATVGSAPPLDPLFAELLDMNGDQRPDLVLASSDGLINVFLNQGGGFAALAIPSPVGGARFAVGDFNRDGQADLVSCCTALGELAVLINQGDGHLSKTVIPNSAFPEGGVPAAGDFDGDGRLDLRVAVRFSNSSEETEVVLMSTAR